MALTHQKYAYIRTFGCQMNFHDSDRISLILNSLGYRSSSDPKSASIIIYNTCTIREKAHHKAISELGRAVEYKRKKGDMIIAVCGCVAQEMGETIFERFPEVDIIFGPDQIHKLPELLKEAIEKKKVSALELIDDEERYVFPTIPQQSFSPPLTGGDQGEGDRIYGSPLPSPLPQGERGTQRGNNPSSFLSIMKGCNLACSYCIVPSVRGREVSKDPNLVIDEVNALVKNGTKEVVLLGQNVNAYTSKGMNFAELVRRISNETDISRIRFVSPHPKDVKEDLIREYAENLKLMPHIHLPLQAGASAVLKKMKRGYTRERYIDICDELKKVRKGLSVTTDIIVGFCGETNEDFEETLDLMRRVEFDSCFAFKYSPRPGTFAAEKMDDNVPEKEKGERLEKVISLQRELTKKSNERAIGKCFEVLAVEPDKMSKGLISGRIPDNRLIHFAGNLNVIGNILTVKITAANANSLAGEIVQ